MSKNDSWRVLKVQNRPEKIWRVANHYFPIYNNRQRQCNVTLRVRAKDFTITWFPFRFHRRRKVAGSNLSPRSRASTCFVQVWCLLMTHDRQMSNKLKTRRTSSVFDLHIEEKPSDLICHRLLSVPIGDYKITLGNLIGIILSLVTLTLHCVAFFTPHWKEVSPNRQPLYVDGVDALIRTEVLTYFNTVHRYSRYSYGLFERCEYPLANVSRLDHERKSHRYTPRNQQSKKCTNNFLPAFDDDQFDQCHSLEYYRFCSKTNERIFDVNNDYLRTTFDLVFDRLPSRSSCSCQIPFYVKACQVLGILAMLFLSLTSVFLAIFPFLKTLSHRLRAKCFGILASILATIFLLVNLLVAVSHFQYEPLEYLNAIERHYRLHQIYKLSLDAKMSIDRLLSTITIQLGYSTILSWIALMLSLIDGILFMLSCRVKKSYGDSLLMFRSISRDSNAQFHSHDTEQTTLSDSAPTSTETSNDSELPLLTPSTLPTRTVVDEESEEAKKSQPIPPVSCMKRPSQLHCRFEDQAWRLGLNNEKKSMGKRLGSSRNPLTQLDINRNTSFSFSVNAEHRSFTASISFRWSESIVIHSFIFFPEYVCGIFIFHQISIKSVAFVETISLV